jgi:hypothetical protein
MSADVFAPTTTTFEPTADETVNDALNAPTGELDLNDPKFASEDIGVNPEGDAYATPPPVPDGEYRAKLKQLDVKDSKQNMVRYAPWSKGDKVALFTALEATIQDPTGKYDNLKVFDRWFSTMLNRDGSTKVSTLLNKLGVPIPGQASHKILMDLLVNKLASEPEVIIVTQWEASCEKCRNEAKANGSKAPRSIVGMNKFPYLPGSTTEHNPDIVCTADAKHGTMTAQPRIAGFKAIK